MMMNYTYRLCWDSLNNKVADCILRVEDQVFIAPVDGNPLYAEYLTWLAAGNTPEPAPEPEPVPELTPAEKLANAGLTIDELKGLLGL